MHHQLMCGSLAGSQGLWVSLDWSRIEEKMGFNLFGTLELTGNCFVQSMKEYVES